MRYLPLLLLLGACADSSGETRLVLAATTSLEDTGLLDTLAIEFANAHPDIRLMPITVGTGQALQLARRGEADVVITHDSLAETRLVQDGLASARMSLMHNDFVILGPAADPAAATGNDPVASLRAIASAATPFISRGDDSGTHRKELALWRAAQIQPEGPWYVEAGLGQGDALILAGQKRAYVLSDRATYLRFKNRIDLAIITEGDSALVNSYGIVVMKGNRSKAADTFADWIMSEETLRLIGSFGRTEFGESLFIPSDHGAVLHDTIPTGER